MYDLTNDQKPKAHAYDLTSDENEFVRHYSKSKENGILFSNIRQQLFVSEFLIIA